jgi:VRR-NUC domain
LAEICRIICEDYSSRAGGLPDLIVWDTAKAEKRCMFVEVKGPGDSLQENQKARLLPKSPSITLTLLIYTVLDGSINPSERLGRGLSCSRGRRT